MVDEIGLAIRELGWGLAPALERLPGSMSGAGVVRACTTAGNAVVVKVSLDTSLQQAARRELAFYRTLAHRVPVKTPNLHRWVDTEFVTALMLSAHDSAPPARDWDTNAWLRVAEDLAALHSTPIDDPLPWTHASWLVNAMSTERRDWSAGFWTEHAAAHDVSYLDTQRPRLAEAVRHMPPCLTHGDCHVDNLLNDRDDLVWADWQAVAMGNPATDLAFLWMRANSDGADVPYDRMVETYLGRVGTHAADGVRFRRSLVAAEIGMLMFGWPAFAAMHPSGEQNRVTKRMVDLLRQWRV